MQLKRITLNSHVNFDFFHFEESDESNADIFVSRYIPSLSTSSVALICFDDTFSNIYDCYGVSRSALGYTFSVYRQIAGDETLYHVGTLTGGELSIIDYNVRNNTNYLYYVYKEDSDSISSAAVTDVITTNWWDWIIAGIYKVDETSDKEEYKIDKYNIWKLSSNLDSGSISQVYNKTVYDSLGTYPKISSGNNNYASGSLTCLLGDVSDKAVDYANKFYSWAYFCNTNELKLLKDRAGNIWVVDITETSGDIEDETVEQAVTVSFNWTEVASVQNMSITE